MVGSGLGPVAACGLVFAYGGNVGVRPQDRVNFDRLDYVVDQTMRIHLLYIDCHFTTVKIDIYCMCCGFKKFLICYLTTCRLSFYCM